MSEKEQDQIATLRIRQKAEAILAEIYRASTCYEVRYQDAWELRLFDGAIGKQMTFNGTYYFGGSRDDNYAEIDLQFRGNKLATIKTEDGFMNPDFPGWLNVWGYQGNRGLKKIQPVLDSTAITVISPTWRESDGIMVRSQINTDRQPIKRVNIYSAPRKYEPATELLLDRIADAMSRSKDQVVVARKLRTLNLPSKLTLKDMDVLADCVVDKIHQEAMRQKHDDERVK